MTIERFCLSCVSVPIKMVSHFTNKIELKNTMKINYEKERLIRLYIGIIYVSIISLLSYKLLFL